MNIHYEHHFPCPRVGTYLCGLPVRDIGPLDPFKRLEIDCPDCLVARDPERISCCAEGRALAVPPSPNFRGPRDG